MSLQDYKQSLLINTKDYAFYALVMACFRQADTYNLEALKQAFPQVWEEFFARYHAPGGCLDGQELEQELEFWNRQTG